MGGYDPPAITRAHQCFRLPARGPFALALAFGVGSSEAAAMGDHKRVDQRPGKPAEFAAAPEVGNCLPTAQVLSHAVAGCGRAVAEQRLPSGEIVGL